MCMGIAAGDEIFAQQRFLAAIKGMLIIPYNTIPHNICTSWYSIVFDSYTSEVCTAVKFANDKGLSLYTRDGPSVLFS